MKGKRGGLCQSSAPTHKDWKGVMGENQTHKIQNSNLVSLAHGGNVGKVGAKQRRLVNDGKGVKDDTMGKY